METAALQRPGTLNIHNTRGLDPKLAHSIKRRRKVVEAPESPRNQSFFPKCKRPPGALSQGNQGPVGEEANCLPEGCEDRLVDDRLFASRVLAWNDQARYRHSAIKLEVLFSYNCESQGDNTFTPMGIPVFLLFQHSSHRLPVRCRLAHSRNVPQSAAAEGLAQFWEHITSQDGPGGAMVKELRLLLRNSIYSTIRKGLMIVQLCLYLSICTSICLHIYICMHACMQIRTYVCTSGKYVGILTITIPKPVKKHSPESPEALTPQKPQNLFCEFLGWPPARRCIVILEVRDVVPT